MAGKYFLDSPAIARSQSSIDAHKTKDGHIVYQDGGSAYSKYVSSQLPANDLSSPVSESYLKTALESPSTYNPRIVSDLLSTATSATSAAPSGTSNSSSNSPLRRHLIVLDLNGTLLKRAPWSGGSERLVTRRPYLECFLQYLAHERTRNAIVKEKIRNKTKFYVLPPPPAPAHSQEIPATTVTTTTTTTTEEAKHVRKKRKRGKPKASTISERNTLGQGSFITQEELQGLYKRIKKSPERYTLLAPLDAMVWTSAQPKSLVKMLESAFGMYQGALVACWTRAMLGLNPDAYCKPII